MPRIGLKPHWATTDGETVRLYLGNAADVLRRLPEKSVQCVMTSPPYYGLRDYGTAEWDGGSADCDHRVYKGGNGAASAKQVTNGGTKFYTKSPCPKCGAVCTDSQVGLEESPEEFIQGLVMIFREIWRVLRDDGTLWLNIGDSYSYTDKWDGIKPKDLMGIPWMLAFALRDDGWYLRQDIIWNKPSPMPEPVRDRCTKAHEYLFLLAKQSSYYYDGDAIREPHTVGTHSRGGKKRGTDGDFKNSSAGAKVGGWNDLPPTEHPGGRNLRSVWTIVSEGYPGTHFAVFPRALVRPCIKAGSSEYGCCADCGTPYRRVTEEIKLTRERPNDYVKRTGEAGTGNSCPNSVAGVEVRTLGWEKSCQCDCDEIRPCIILDPFIGSGTTSIVSIELGRWSWGVELSEDYLEDHAKERVIGELMSRPALAHLAGLEPPKAVSGGREI